MLVHMFVRVYVCVYLCACVLKFCVCVYLGRAQAYSFLEIGLLSASVCVFSYALCSGARSRFLISAHHCINKLSAVHYRKLSVHV